MSAKASPPGILIVTAEGAHDQAGAVLQRQLEAASLQPVLVGAVEAVSWLGQAAAGGHEPAVMLVAPGQQKRLAVARALRAACSSAHIMLINGTGGMGNSALQRDELRHAPMMGNHWSLAELGDPQLPRLVREAAELTRRRLKLRTTLDRANVRLAAPKALDSVDYRRLVLSEHYLASFLAQAKEAIVAFDSQLQVLYWNASAETLFAMPAQAVLGVHARNLPFWSAELEARLGPHFMPHEGAAIELRCALAGREVALEIGCSAVRDEAGRYVGTTLVIRDASLRHHALEAERRERTDALHNAEMALHRSQKLESLGKLTGGVAHDFNNILQVIGGNLELLKLHLAGQPDSLSRLSTAIGAVERGAKLSSQLLAFARRQPLRPMPTNVGRIVQGMDDLLRRALGEAVDVECIIGDGLWSAMVDQNQLENVILNLAINARDAMAAQGRLTVELGNAILDDDYARANAEVAAGQYVMLAVSDTGSGMPPEIVERAFEPFFTTKPEGEGTGLGLSMAYGFIKQSGGHIKIYSEPGHGTTFRLYLPRVLEAEQRAPDLRAGPVVGGTETILVVEDDQAVRATVVDILSGLGYTVLKASDGEGGLAVLQSGIPVDLLFTDVVMPGPVRSPDLARRARELLPDIEVLFTSGYTQNAIVHGGRLDPGVELISKPYRREDLARRIRHLLANRQQAANNRQQAASTGPAPAGNGTPRARRILVVEDGVDALQMLCESLALLGHQAEGAASAEQALDALAAGDFEVLLTDVGLPGMSGTALAREAVAAHPALQVIFASGYGAVEQAGFASLSLPKPYTLARLQAVLSELR